MSENGTCCAHQRVVYRTEVVGFGVRGWWECEMCGTKFQPSTTLASREEEIARLTTEVEEWKNGREFNHAVVLAYEGMVENLTAEVEEWKNRAIAAEGDLAWEKTENPNFRTLRRSSVRVDVLLRWIQSRSRVLSILGGSIMSRAGSNPGEQAKALLSWLTSVLSKRQARTTNTKGGRR